MMNLLSLALSVFWLMSLMPEKSFSQSFSYETALVLPWTSIEKSINKTLLKTQHLSLGPIQLTTQGVPVVISETTLDFNIQLNPLVASQNETFWKTKSLVLNIASSGFQIKKDIVQNVNGINLVIHLEAQCDPFTLSQQSAQLETNWAWTSSGTLLQTQLKNLELFWPENSWQMGPIVCHGPLGFADVVQNEIKKQLENPNEFKPQIANYLQKYLNEQLTNSLKPWRNPRWIYNSTSSLTEHGLYVEMLGIETLYSKGIILKGLLSWIKSGEQKSPNTSVIPLRINENLVSQVGDSATLVFSKQSLEGGLRQVLESARVQTNLNSISAFSSLLKSRFMQFFVWPDLWNYSKKSQFNMLTQLNSKQGVTKINITNDPQNKMSLQGFLDSWIFSEKNQKTWNYIYLKTKISMLVSFSLQKNILDFSFTNEKLKTKYQFGAEYLNTFNPTTYVGTSIIDQALTNSSVFQKRSLLIPSIQITADLSFQPQGLLKSADQENFFMTWVQSP